TGYGDEYYIPFTGVSKIVEYLESKAKGKGVHIRYNTKVLKVEDGRVHLENKVLKADLIVVAIAPFDYKKIDIKDEKPKEVVKHLRPSGKAKLIIELSDKVDLDTIEYIEEESPDYEIYFTAKPQDKILYCLFRAKPLLSKRLDLEFVKTQILKRVRAKFNKPGLSIS